MPSDAALALVVAEDSLWHAQSMTGPRSTLLARAAAMAAADVVKSAAVSDRDRLRANQIRETSQILLTVRLIEEASETPVDWPRQGRQAGVGRQAWSRLRPEGEERGVAVTDQRAHRDN